MPRPKTKTDLLDLSQSNFQKINQFVDSLDTAQQHAEFPSGTLNRNIRDVLAHLHQWHMMLIDWYNVGLTGEKPAIPAEGYTWKTLPDLNKKIQEQYSNTSLDEAQRLLNDSSKQVRQLIKKHSEEELFEKKRYKWTGTTSLAAYLISATSSHYDWALKLIKKSLK